MVTIDHDEVWVDLTLYHPYEAGEELRGFDATVLALVGEDAEGLEQIGEVQGHVCLALRGRDVRDAADDIDTDTELLGRIADEIVGLLFAAFRHEVRAVVLLGNARLMPEHRGQGLTGVIVDRLLDTLQLDPRTTLVVAQPEPQRENGGPMEYGPARDEALERLRRHYDGQRFEQWEDSKVWWRPLGRRQP